MFPSLSSATLILGPRPGKKSFNRLASLELTHCCTLLSDREGAPAIEPIAKRLGCAWVWLPIEGGGLDTLRATDMAGHVRTLDRALEGTEAPRVYLHCSAGIHRTGFFAYLLLRLGGLDPNAALMALTDLRPVTAEQVGEDRIELAESLLGTTPFQLLA